MTPEQKEVIERAIKMLRKTHVGLQKGGNRGMAFSVHGVMRELMALQQEVDLAEKGKRFGAKKAVRKKAPAKKLAEADPWGEGDK